MKMPDESWNRLVRPVDEGELDAALIRVRSRAAERRWARAKRWRVLGLAAGFVLTFAAGLLAGRMSVAGPDLTRMWALGGSTLEASRATFIAVPAARNP
jgi:hypothetical protein